MERGATQVRGHDDCATASGAAGPGQARGGRALERSGAVAQTVPRFLPIHGAYQARIIAMSASRSSLGWISGPKPMTLSG